MLAQVLPELPGDGRLVSHRASDRRNSELKENEGGEDSTHALVPSEFRATHSAKSFRRIPPQLRTSDPASSRSKR
jgi:hypothetical protein